MKLIFVLTGSIKGARGARGGVKRKTKEREREKEIAASSGPTLKLTKEFRFLYNRFNLIPTLDRSGEDVNGERISISERYSPDHPGYPLTRYLPGTLSYTPPPLRPCISSSFSRFSWPLFVRITARKVFLDTVESRRHDRDLRLFQSP